MPWTSRSSTTTRGTPIMYVAKMHKPPVTPGEVLIEEFLRPLGISQAELSVRIGITRAHVNEIARGKRTVTPETALRFERALGMPAQFWLNLQLAFDLYNTLHSRRGARIKNIKPFPSRRAS